MPRQIHGCRHWQVCHMGSQERGDSWHALPTCRPHGGITSDTVPGERQSKSQMTSEERENWLIYFLPFLLLQHRGQLGTFCGSPRGDIWTDGYREAGEGLTFLTGGIGLCTQRRAAPLTPTFSSWEKCRMGQRTLLCCLYNLAPMPEDLCLGHSRLLEQQSDTRVFRKVSGTSLM